MAIHQNCHLLAVIGGKGGVGKSVFAANLSVALMNELRAKVLLVDLDQKSCGDQNIITGLRPKKTVAEVCNYPGVISAATLDALVTPHPSGLHFIGAVSSADQKLSAPTQILKKQLSIFSQFYNFIVVDLGSDFSELQMGVIEDASAILTLTTPEVLAVNQTKRVIGDLMAQTVPSEFFQIVINGLGRTSLDPKLVAQNLGKQVVGIIPQDEVTTYASIQRQMPFVLTAPQAPISQAYYDIVRRLTGGVLQKLKTLARPAPMQQKTSVSVGANPADVAKIPGASTGGIRKKQRDLTPQTLLKMQVHSELIREMDVNKDMMNTKGDPAKEQELRTKTQKTISMLVDKISPGMSRDDRTQIIKQILDEALGLGPLEELLADPNVTEIMVNGCDRIYVEKAGKLSLSPVTFTSNQQLRNVIERIVIPLGRKIDQNTPYCDARLPDGSRVNAVIEPLAIDGPAVTIRKFPTRRVTMEDYTQRFHSLTQPMADFLKVCVEQKLNIIISGGTGSGKTTLLNVLSSYIPSDERIVTVEDAAELQLNQDHVVRLETKPPSVEGTGAVSIRDLVRNSLRMRPNRIIVGESRDGAAIDMLQAMNTGHDGSMTTIHANEPREAIARLETLCMMAGMELPVEAIRSQIASAVHLIVQIKRYSDHSRKISSIAEVQGMQGDKIALQEIFGFKEEGFDKNRKVIGQFQAKGRIPLFLEKFEQRGIKVPRSIFTPEGVAGSSAQSSSASTAQPAARPTGTPPQAKAAPVAPPPKKASGDNS